MDSTKIRELRLLPPLAIARLGSAPDPMDNYTLEDDPEDPIGFRKIKGAETLDVDETTGEIRGSHVPETVSFKQNGKFRRVAPFLEVFAVTADDRLVPLTPELLAANGLTVDDVEWRVHVANRKVTRRTDDDRDTVSADTGWFTGHDSRILEGHSPNFVNDTVYVDFGRARFIRPNAKFPGLRFRFTPATGLIYGPRDPVKFEDPGQYVPPPERLIYDNAKGKWPGFEVPPAVDNDDFKPGMKFWDETLPPALFAIKPPAPSWFNDNIAISRGFFDDACDGVVEVRLKGKRSAKLAAAARVTSGPPVVNSDSLFVRTLADELDQVLQGPTVPADEPDEVTRARAEDIVRRAFETVRFLNVEVMNGNTVNGRPALDFDTMPMEEASDTERLGRPVFSPETADNAAVVALHQQVFAALRGGATPWFLRLLRRPEDATDYTDHGRRKMPALMIGGDNNYLALTHRMIDTIAKAAREQPFAGTRAPAKEGAAPWKSSLTPRNLSAQLHYVAAGNPVSSRMETSIGNCCPGLEVDFRAVWRRMFEGVVLREYDNLVVEVETGVEVTRRLKHHRLLRIAGIPTMRPMTGPNPLDLNQSVVVATESNPHGLSPLEWSNALAHVLWESVGKTVVCDFSADLLPYTPAPFDPEHCITLKLKVRPFFEPGTVLISRALAEPGELTQGLCSPWQNDYRECSCYYWASARPDFVNVEVTEAGRSAGDNWMQIERTGRYVPDDYRDDRLIDYDHLFHDWEKWLRVQIGGRDARFHVLRGDAGFHLLAVDGSRLFDADPELIERLRAATSAEEIGSVLADAGLGGPPLIDDEPLDPPPVHALSLAVAQSCNLGCGYCYAQQGGFGGAAKNMPLETARRSVELLVAKAAPGARLNLAFLGGEPLVNRTVLQAVTRYAAELGAARGVVVTFSITTNGTLVTPADGDFFEEHGFAVTVSLDGPRAVHDLLRPDRRGGGSFDRILSNVRPLLARQKRMQVSARVTVTPRNLGLRETLEQFVADGFHSVGFSPMLSAYGGNGEMQAADLEVMLGEMIDCGREYERRTRLGERFPFANLANALKEIEKGTHRPYPCGAGAGYLGVSADGDLAACHRFVGDTAGAMGTLSSGVDVAAQAKWLTERHVHRQEPCKSCWARYLCGGGCHHEAIRRGRPACDYIRGWLHYCLEVYLRLPRRRFTEVAAAAV